MKNKRTRIFQQIQTAAALIMMISSSLYAGDYEKKANPQGRKSAKPGLSSKASENSLELDKLIDIMESGDLFGSEKETLRVVRNLVVLAVENPHNLIPVAYLWALQNRIHAKKLIGSENFERTFALIKQGPSQIISEKYEDLGDEVQMLLEENFLFPSEAIASVSHAIKQKTVTPKMKKTCIDYLIVIASQKHSFRALVLLNKNKNNEDFKGYFPKIKPKALFDIGNDLTPSISNKFLRDGQAEFDQTKDGRAEKREIFLVIAALLGHEEASESLYFSDRLKNISPTAQLVYAQYLARQGIVSWASLVVGSQLLTTKQNIDEAVSFLEFYLALPDNEIHYSKLPKELKNKSIEFGFLDTLIFHYLSLSKEQIVNKNVENALLNGWRKGYKLSKSERILLINCEFSDEIINELNELNSKDSSYALNHLLLVLYTSHAKETFDAQVAKKYIFGCLNDLKNNYRNTEDFTEYKNTLLSLIIFFEDSAGIILKGFNEEDLKNLITALDELYLAGMVQPEDLSSYYCIMAAFNWELNENETMRYLRLAMEWGNQKAEFIFYILLEYNQFFNDDGSRKAEIDKKTLKQIDTPPEDINKNVLIDAPFPSILQQQFEPLEEKSSAKTSQAEPEAQEEVLVEVKSHEKPKTRKGYTSKKKTMSKKGKEQSEMIPQEAFEKQEAKKNIQSFIAKWNVVHWKSSNLQELYKDFKNYVLDNKAVPQKNSNWIHGHHGRVKNKYGSRVASSFEISTLLALAQKTMAAL
jgi:hypothetical protein